MATVIRSTDPSTKLWVAAVNDIKAQIGAASAFHLDKSELVPSAAAASDLPTSLTLCKQLMQIEIFHTADTLAHKVADVTNVLGYAVSSVVDLASAILAANDLKAKYNATLASTTYHYNADATNVIATANATDLPSLQTLLNAFSTAMTAHLASGPAAKSLRLVGA